MKEKMNNLRSAYRKINRQLHDQRSGAAASESTEPTLWYYKEMEFLRDQMEGWASMSSLTSSRHRSGPSTDPHTPEEYSEGLADMEPNLRLSTSDEVEYFSKFFWAANYCLFIELIL